jgi:hypothetical protein
MAGRFGSKFKKRTSLNTSNIRTSSSPTVSRPPPRRVSKPSPVRTSSSKINKLSLDISPQKAWGAGANTGTSATDDFVKPSTYEDAPMSEFDAGKKDHIENSGTQDNNIFTTIGNWFKPYDNPVEAGAVLMEEKDLKKDLTPQFKDNKYEDLAPGTFGSHVSPYTAGTSSFIDDDETNRDPSNIKFTEGEEIPQEKPSGYKEATVADYLANDGQGEYRGQFYKPGNATADAHQEALDLQARTKFENSIQSNYFQNFTAGNMNDDMMKGLHNKIDKVKMSKDYKDELYSFYDTKKTDFNSKKTNKKLSKAEKIKAKFDKDPLSVSQEDMAKFSVYTGQNIKPGGFDEFYNGTGTGFMDLTKINDKGNKKNKPIWFDYQDLGY